LDLVARGFKIPKENILVRWVPNTILIHAHRGAYGITVEATMERETNKKYEE
jgi:hypothetical protein